jgi:hypothetical protein
MIKPILFAAAFCALAACTTAEPARVATSGKSAVALADLPAEVLAAATALRPTFTASEAEAETREGRRYFDVGGTLADGSEIEFDIMEEGGRWRVVEVHAAARRHDAAFTPTRIIESDQTDGVVIYELFGPKGGDPQGRKVEIKWDGTRAEVLTKEWAH